MSFFVETRWAGAENAPSRERMKEILAELDEVDPEHPETWLTHESGWTLSAHETGRVVLDNGELGVPPRYLRAVSPRL